MSTERGNEASESCCGGANGNCSSGTGGDWGRRDFLKAIGIGAGAVAFGGLQTTAGPFTRADFAKLVPADKKLRAEWVASLTARGEREVYRGSDLEKIGMPIGGICAGQLYLGGDGRLWHWDLFNKHVKTGAEHYAKPLRPRSPLDQGFVLRVTIDGKAAERRLDRSGWKDVSFIGEYPIGYVEYRDPDCPLTVKLEAFSPFIPLNTEDSSLPVTVMEFTVKNNGTAHVQAELLGWLENAVCLESAKLREGVRRNEVLSQPDLLFLNCSAADASTHAAGPPNRPDILFDDFESGTYENWTVKGTAFGKEPEEVSKVPAYQGDLGGKGKRVVNSHASAPGGDVGQRDAATGRLLSRPFKIERNYIRFLIGGGDKRGKTSVHLLVGDETVETASGSNENKMHPVNWNVRRWAGKTGRIQVVDDATGSWGNIGLDEIVFSDQPGVAVGPIADEADFGTMGLGLLRPEPGDSGIADLEAWPSRTGTKANTSSTRAFDQKLVGSLGRKLKLAPGATATVMFVLTWHLPNLKLERLPTGRYYGTKFTSALNVALYLARESGRLSSQTRLWHDTWYDSSLPYWFLDRTFLNTSILATSTCYRLGNGRFYGWEGVGCCQGTCGHVWQYAHAVARLFPELERNTREQVDFGLALQPDGAIHFRGEFNNIPAVDGQAGTILRALREHQMSADDSFLRRNWPRIRKATEWLIGKDANGDGLIETNQHNTLDTDWFGAVAWLSGLYLAALAAAEMMAGEVGDDMFAGQCHNILEAGRKNLVAELFDGEYFVNKPDAKHLDAINSGSGCEIDQVFGQSWAFQVGLPRVFPRKETLVALKSLWRYNFTPDVGPYREVYKAGRWYAMPGEAGLLMCTFPRSDWDYAQAKGKGPAFAAGYFNECMNGFEYQVAGHMIWEGLLTEGLAVTRAVHDRYHPSRRNPWNEVECGDHYARSMASYGVFLAACGFEYDGPQGRIAFAPRLNPENFKCAFTAAEGWGTFAQRLEKTPGTVTKARAELSVRWGRVRLRSVLLGSAIGPLTAVRVSLGGKEVDSTFSGSDAGEEIRFKNWIEATPDQVLMVVCG